MPEINEVAKKRDTFLNWMALMKAHGIKGNKELVARINAHNKTGYLHWEVTRWQQKTRSVPRTAHDHMLRELIYYLIHGEIVGFEITAEQRTKMLKVKHLTNRRLENILN